MSNDITIEQLISPQRKAKKRMFIGLSVVILKDKDVVLGELDRTNYSLDSYIKADTKLKVIRVEKETEVVEELIAFSSEKQEEPNLLVGERQVVTEGRNGINERTYEVVKENGVVVAKSVVDEKVTRQPVTEVVSIGTKVVEPEPVVVASDEQSAASESTFDFSANNYSSVFATVESEPKSSKKELYVEATAYTPFCEGCSGTTKMGINVRLNTNIKVIAVDPRVIPLGSKVWVEGYGYAIAADTGGAIKNLRIDVLLHSKSEAFKWGRRKNVKVLIL